MAFETARWIGMPKALRGRCAPLFRRTFELEAPVRKATLLICGLGYHEASINGERVGDHVLDPAQTDYEERCLYVSHDVSALIRPGRNSIGVMLGDGWFNQDIVWKARYKMVKGFTYGEPCLLAELVVQYADGRQACIPSDGFWRCAPGPITANNVYMGETYDSRLAKAGWDLVDFADASWMPVDLVPAPEGRLELQDMPPIKKIEEIRPVGIKAMDSSCLVVDMGQNFAGWVRIRLQAAVGTEIKLRFAETIDKQGYLDTASTGVFATSVEQIDTYICSGEGVEIWEPRFTYHGFRYIEVCGWPGVPVPGDIIGIAVHTDLSRAGAFACSDDRLNRLHDMALWTFRSNIHGLPTDCPARERCGWLGDAHMMCEYSIYNFRGEQFWEKYLDDIESARRLNGGLPTSIAPGMRGRSNGSPDWMAALILIPWYLYVYYGNRSVLQKHWDGMSILLRHFDDTAQDWILSNGLGDWCDPKHSTRPTYTPEAITTTLWYHECSRIMGAVSMVLGKTEENKEYTSRLPLIAAAFQRRFFNPERATFGSQTADAMALHFGLVPDGFGDAVVDSLVKDIKVKHHHHTIGIVGIRFLFEVLTRHGHGDTALALMHQDTYPSFGDLIGRGATTLWEYWGEEEIDRNDGARSLNHPMMGGFDNWFYNTLAGIRPDHDNPGFSRFFIEPHPIPGIRWVTAHHDSPYGRIVSEWTSENGVFSLHAIVPEQTVAMVQLPGSNKLVRLVPGNHHLQCKAG